MLNNLCLLEWYFKHVARAQQFYSGIACVASVPVRAERNIRPREAARRSFHIRDARKMGREQNCGPTLRSARTGTLGTQADSGKICHV